MRLIQSISQNTVIIQSRPFYFFPVARTLINQEGEDMDEANIAIMVMTGLLAAIILGFFIWGLVSGQFRNPQEASRRMIQNNVQDQHDLSAQKTRREKDIEKK